MNIFVYFLTLLYLFFSSSVMANHIDGFQFWSLGKDDKTVMLLPSQEVNNSNAKRLENNQVIAHGKFVISGWGELYSPLLQEHKDTEKPVDISSSNWVEIEYASNREVQLQLRHAFIHGGTHNHFQLPNTFNKYQKIRINFASFQGGLSPLDLKRVAKFNFAMIGKNDLADYSELKVRKILIENFKPETNGKH